MHTTASSMILTMDLEVNPPEYVIHEGVITDLAIGRLKNGESQEVITSLCFLASGRFDIFAVVRCFGTSGVDSRTARAHTTAVVKEME
jgi:trafficking protein particle complex subunit 9